MEHDEGWTENDQRPTIAPHYSDIFVRVGDGDGAIIIPTGDFVLGDDGHFRRVVPDGTGGYRRDDDYFAPLRDGSVKIPPRSAFEGRIMMIDSQMVRVVMSDVDPEDEDLEDDFDEMDDDDEDEGPDYTIETPYRPPEEDEGPEDDLDANTEGDLDEDDDDDLGDTDELDEDDEDETCTHGKSTEEHCPVCDGEEDEDSGEA